MSQSNNTPLISTVIRPSIENTRALSREEMARLKDNSSEVKDRLRACALAILAVDSEPVDDPQALLKQHEGFDLDLHQNDQGISIELHNAPASAFVDGHIIRNTGDMLFSALRDLSRKPNGANSTEEIFDMLREAGLFRTESYAGHQQGYNQGTVVCWGGHAIHAGEYDYTKEVGYRLGLRGLNICTGCGPGAMKGPMKGAAISHSKQRIRNGQYIGLTEPGIIASESPNPIVNNLVILPDIEKRLEAFVRLGHAFIVFPGGVGTAEEILYLLGILLDPANQNLPFPLTITGPASAKAWLASIDEFIRGTIGTEASKRYRLIAGDPEEVAKHTLAGITQVKQNRLAIQNAMYFNWKLAINQDFQHPFEATHANMSQLQISKDLPAQTLAANLRRAFSGIVAGNVKPEGILAVKQQGKFQIHGDPGIMHQMDNLLRSFMADGRMKLQGEYNPCYEIVG